MEVDVQRFSRGIKDVSKPVLFRADLGSNLDRSGLAGRISGRTQIADIGDLTVFTGLEVIDGTNYFVTTAGGPLRTGADASLLFYSQSRAKEIDWSLADLETRYPPDAVLRDGKWSGKEIPSRK